VVDGEQRDDKACQEEEHRNVKKGRDGFYGKGQLKSFYAFGKERAKAGTLVNCALGLGETEVSTSPVLLEGCQ